MAKWINFNGTLLGTLGAKFMLGPNYELYGIIKMDSKDPVVGDTILVSNPPYLDLMFLEGKFVCM